VGLGGLLGGLKQMFKGADKPIRDELSRDPRKPFSSYPLDRDKTERIKWLLDYFYYQSAYEKIQLHRKWFRNRLFFGGYHDNVLSDVGMSFDAIGINSGEYSFASNFYRDFIRYSAAIYVQTAPEFIAQPTSGDPESQAVAESARAVLDIEKENVGYDAIRAMEAFNLRTDGNSFRYSYYSVDPRYGFQTVPVYEDVEIEIDGGSWQCPNCGINGQGHQDICPQCGPDSPVPIQNNPPQKATIPKVAGKVAYPKGQEECEVVNAFQIYVRSSVPLLRQAPYLLRVRMVDSVALQATFPKAKFGSDTMPGDTVNASEDIGLIYQQAIPDLPNDPTQYPGWYERATTQSKTPLIEGWIRPSQYFFDKELVKDFPEGLYGAKAEDTLLTTRNESMDDHWVHFKHIHVDGRFWGDGEDDLIPEQMLLDATDRMLLRHVDFNTMPLMMIDAQRSDKNNWINDAANIVELKNLGNKSIEQAAKWFPGGQISTDVWKWRDTRKENMSFHSGVTPAATGQPETGNPSFGGRETSVARTQSMLSPLQLMYKEANELWGVQMLKLAANNWLDDRVQATMGVNGQWEYKKLRGELLDMDRVRVKARIIPFDPAKVDTFNQAIAVGAFNPQLPPVVRRKVLELHQLPVELDEFNEDSKVQQKEIEGAKQGGGQFPEPAIWQNDDAHMASLTNYANSDEFEKQPAEFKTGLQQHYLAHIQNKANKMAIAGAIQGMGAEAGGQGQQGNEQVSPQERQAEGQRHGAEAKPHRPQPPGGNQHAVGRRGMSDSAQQRRRNGRTR
jgi:hypothetical protein